MELFIYGFYAVIGLSVLVGIFRMINFIIQTKNVIEASNRAYTSGSFTGMNGLSFGSSRGNDEFSVLLGQLETMMEQYNSHKLNDFQVKEMELLMGQTANQFHDMNSLSQQKYDTQVGGMMGYAASNGLDWNPYS